MVDDITIDTTQLTRLIPKDGISIDDEKLSGIDNFIVDARRAKITVKLPNGNSLNSSLIDVLTDKTLLLQDNIETVDRLSLLFSKEKVLSEFADEKVFFRHFETPDYQTWMLPDTGYFTVQSIDLLEIIYTMVVHGLGIGDSLSEHRIDGYNQSFCYSLRNLFAFIARGIQIDNLLEPDSNANVGDLFLAYMNQIYYGLGDAIIDYLDSKYGISTLNDMFKQYVREDGTGFQYNTLSFFLWITDFIVANQSTWGFSVFFPDDSSTLFGSNRLLNVAIFLSSIIKFEWFESVRTRFFENGNRELYMARPYGTNIRENIGDGDTSWYVNFSRWHYIPFLGASELVLRYKYNYGSGISPNLTNIFMSKIKQSIMVRCIDTKSNGIRFGKTRVATVLNEDGTNDSGMAYERENFTEIVNDFNPVYRYYSIAGDTYPYYFYMDNIDHQSLFSHDNQTIYCLGGFQNTNWIYFDHITCHEVLLAEDDNNIYADNIPIYDEESGNQTDNFGLYIYRDYFDKYYVKNRSNISNIYGEIEIDGNRTYIGMVDFNSVNIERNQVTFDLVDVTGLTIENIKKLQSFIEFSQFDTGGNGLAADTRAGTTIGQFINTMIKQPFPYRHELANQSFDIGNNEGLSNKVLQEISAEDAFLAGIQCSRSLIYTNAEGQLDIVSDILSAGNTATIDGEILQVSTSQEFKSETFNIDKLKNIAGYNQFTPAIVNFYMQSRNKYSVEKTVEIFNQTSPINLLDKITINEKTYIVMNKNIDLRNKVMKITVIGES